MRATVDSVTRVEDGGTVLVTALVVGATVLQVESSAGIPDPPVGGTAAVLVNDEAIAYTGVLDADEYGSGVTVDTIVLAVPSTSEAPLGARVTVPGEARYVASLYLEGSTELETATLSDGLIKATSLKLSTVGLGTRVLLEDHGGEWVVVRILNEDPSDDGRAITAGSLPLSVVLDRTDAADQNVAADLIRFANMQGVPIEGAILTAVLPDGGSVTYDLAAGTTTTMRADGSIAAASSPSNSYSSGDSDLGRLTAWFTEIRQSMVVDPGGRVTLLVTPGPPPAGPQGEGGWDDLWTSPKPTFTAGGTISLAEVGGVLFSHQLIPGSADEGNVIQLRTLAATGGDVSVVWEAPLSAKTLAHGLVPMSSNWYVLVGLGTGGYRVRWYDSNGVKQGAWAPTGVSSPAAPCIGDDGGSHIIVAWTSSGGRGYTFQKCDPITGSVVSTFVTPDLGYPVAPPRSVQLGSFDFGSPYWWVYNTASPVGFIIDPVTGLEDMTREWSLYEWTDPSFIAGGIVWNTALGRFQTLAADGRLRNYTGARIGSGWPGYPAWLGIDFEDGTHKTPVSPLTKITAYQRGRVKATTNDFPGFADRYGLFYGEGVSAPARTSLFRVQTPAAGDRAWTVTNPPTSGTNPVATSTYAAGTPAELWGVTRILKGDYSNANDVDTRLIALEAGGGGGGGGGGIGGVGGGHWGDIYESFGVKGGSW